MTNTQSHAKTELDILCKSAGNNPDDRPIIEEFIPEILALCEKFGKSGQSGGSAPYVASAITQAIQKLLLHKPICPITGIDEEWTYLDYGDELKYQNNREYGLFKHEDGKVTYVNAIVKQVENGGCWSGPFWLSREDYLTGDRSKMIRCSQEIKGFPFTPKTFYIDCIEEEVAPDDWEMYIKDPKQLDEVWEYYKKPEFLCAGS